MLDIEYIQANIKGIEEAAKNKNFPIDLPKLLEVNEQRRDLIHKVDQLRTERNTISKNIPKLQGEEKQNAIQQGKDLRVQLG
ncbi:MAG TPA: serine--tRNA ligase, partial [Spirochaetes bacterium]|nr:serine--tRNA ligase [Spirochaetota bacterium]